ncbi:MAG: glycosyltransferase [Flavobacterium sp.]|nr:MAG: glycosyltransferase [Flavobacterium sp.]
MYKIVIVVPCYNEEKRFQPKEFARLKDFPEINICFVDDGSIDHTGRILKHFCESNGPHQFHWIQLPKNKGKAEAVRTGLLQYIDQSQVVGYFDADLATPISELVRLSEIIQNSSDIDILLASRIKLLGRRIDRKVYRHYLGRIFATVASFILQAPIYDTQCGAKFFRTGPSLSKALKMPFRSKWVFDVELLGRLLYESAQSKHSTLIKAVEVPLEQWREIEGSKLSLVSMLKAGLELLALFFFFRELVRDIQLQGSRIEEKIEA